MPMAGTLSGRGDGDENRTRRAGTGGKPRPAIDPRGARRSGAPCGDLRLPCSLESLLWLSSYDLLDELDLDWTEPLHAPGDLDASEAHSPTTFSVDDCLERAAHRSLRLAWYP